MDKKNRRRILLITLFFLILVSIPIPLIIYNLMTRNPDLYVIRLEGNVSEVITFSYEDIVDGTYGIIDDQEFEFLNQYGTRYTVTYTGVSVWALLDYAQVHYPNSTGLYFKSYDNFVTELLSLEDIKTYSELIIIAFKIGNKVLKYTDEDGGPMRSIVNLSVTEPEYNSQYWAKYVNTIIVI